MWKFNQSLLKSCRFVVPMLFAFAGLGTTLSVSIPARAQSTVRTNGNGTRVDVTLNRQPNESYETLVGRAQTAARNTLTRSFNQNPSASRVSVTVLGENAGQVVPIMSLNVDRQTWASNPNIQRLANYFPNSRSLLGLATPASPNINIAQSPSTTTGQTAPNGVRVLPNGTVVTGNGVRVLPNGTVVTNNGGTQVLPNGNIVPGNTPGQNNQGNLNGQNSTGANNLGGQNNNGIGTVSPNNPGNNNTNTNGTTGLNDLGTTGINGTNGTTGVNGTNGTTGINGTNGTTGINSTNGNTGINGTNGNTEINGTNGTTEINGTNGTTGINGTNGTTGGQGGL